MRLPALRLIVSVAKMAIAPATCAGSSSGATLANFRAINSLCATSRAAAALTRFLPLAPALDVLRACATRLAGGRREDSGRRRRVEAAIHVHHRNRCHEGHGGRDGAQT